MKLSAVYLHKISGNKDQITSKIKIDGEIEFVPLSNGRGLLTLPISVLIDKNIENAERGLLKIPSLSKLDLVLREILSLTKNEAISLLSAPPGEIIFKRAGWGQEFIHVIRKMN